MRMPRVTFLHPSDAPTVNTGFSQEGAASGCKGRAESASILGAATRHDVRIRLRPPDPQSPTTGYWPAVVSKHLPGLEIPLTADIYLAMTKRFGEVASPVVTMEPRIKLANGACARIVLIRTATVRNGPQLVRSQHPFH